MGENANRFDYLDVAKGIGMFAIIWGHVMLKGWSNQFVYAFHIPLFFFISGMLFNASKYKNLWCFIVRRAKTLLLPYVMFSVLTWGIWVAVKYFSNEHVYYLYPLKETIRARGSVGYMLHNLPLWFVPCLFVVEILYYYINKLPVWLNLLVCCLFAYVGHYMVNGGRLDFYSKLPWSIEGAMSAILFYAMGNVCVKYVSHQRLNDVVVSKKGWFIGYVVIVTALLLFLSLINDHVSIGSNELGRNTLLFYFNGLLGISTTILFSVLLSSGIFSRTNGFSFVRWFGENSFIVMATHYPIKEAFANLVGMMAHCGKNAVAADFGLSLAVFLLTLIMDSMVVIGVSWLKQRDHSLMVKWQMRGRERQ